MTPDDEVKPEINYQVKFESQDKNFQLKNNTFSISGYLSLDDLDELLNKMLITESVINNEVKSMKFDYFINSQIVIDTIHNYCVENSLSNENQIVIYYNKKRSPVKQKPSKELPDWIYAVDFSQKYILVSCFDGNSYIFTDNKSNNPMAHVQNNAHNTNADVKFVPDSLCESNTTMFLASDSDNNIFLYEFSSKDNSFHKVCKYVGHEKPVQTLAISNSNRDIFASGSDDRMLKLWNLFSEDISTNGDAADSKKRVHPKSPISSMAPIITFSGHTDRISKVLWSSNKEILTSSWDFSARLWDVDKQTTKVNIASQHAIFDICIDPKSNNTMLTASDKIIQQWDIRSRSVTLSYSSFYKTLVNQVCWPESNPNEFLSGAHYGPIALWDTRNNKTPVTVLQRIRGKLFTLENFGNDIYFGGEDSKLYNFSL